MRISTLPIKNIIFEHLKEDITLICGKKPNNGNSLKSLA